jgi:hypothetical protein
MLEALPKAVVACPGNGINANLVDKARKMGISLRFRLGHWMRYALPDTRILAPTVSPIGDQFAWLAHVRTLQNFDPPSMRPFTVSK